MAPLLLCTAFHSPFFFPEDSLSLGPFFFPYPKTSLTPGDTDPQCLGLFSVAEINHDPKRDGYISSFGRYSIFEGTLIGQELEAETLERGCLLACSLAHATFLK